MAFLHDFASFVFSYRGKGMGSQTSLSRGLAACSQYFNPASCSLLVRLYASQSRSPSSAAFATR
jgi:hypothetical protein